MSDKVYFGGNIQVLHITRVLSRDLDNHATSWKYYY